MKSNVNRISYYTKKVAEYGSMHHSRKRNRYRFNRLMAYKKLMHDQFNKAN